jgi:hypothetical protein
VTKEIRLATSELAKIPFIDSKNIGGRVLTTLTFFEEGEWQMWFPLTSGLIRRIKGEPSEADYFARMPEKDTDIYLDFLNFMTQRACWTDAMPFIDGIRNDIHNLGASLGKIDLFHHVSSDKSIEVARFVSTELEYIFGVCRSLFDLLQEVIATLWQRIDLLDKSIKKRELPKSFGRVVLRDERLMTVKAIQTQLRVPAELAAFYYRHGPFFQMLRQYRNNVVHSGKDFNSIFVTEKGFAVSANVDPFASFGVWKEEHMLPNRLASLRPIIAHVITETLTACEDFARMIQKIIQFPPEIAPGFKLFIRGYHNHQLLAMKDVLTNSSWWEAKRDNAEDA